jgi:hypothetical protein
MDGYYSRNGAQNIENVSKNDPKSMNTIRETDPKIIENDQ